MLGRWVIVLTAGIMVAGLTAGQEAVQDDLAGQPSALRFPGSDRDGLARMLLNNPWKWPANVASVNGGPDSSFAFKPESSVIAAESFDDFAVPAYGEAVKRDGRFGPSIGPFVNSRINGVASDGTWSNRGGGSSAQLDQGDRGKADLFKRKAGGKLCYINPIACFGRRQRDVPVK